jgi:hypothetical protein
MAFLACQLGAAETAIYEPRDKLVTYSDKLLCRGVLSEPGDILINRNIGRSGDSFEAKVPLKYGRNLILLEIFSRGARTQYFRRVLRLPAYQDVPRNHWAKEAIELVSATLGDSSPANRYETKFQPDSLISRKDYYSWLKELSGFSVDEEQKDQANKALTIIDILSPLALLTGDEFNNLNVTEDMKTFLKQNFSLEKIADISLERTYTRAEAAYLLYKCNYIKQHIDELYAWDNYQEAARWPDHPEVKVTEKLITPRKILLNGQNDFTVRLKVDKPELVKEISADFSLLDKNLGQSQFNKVKGGYEAKGYVSSSAKAGVVKVPCLIKLIDGSYFLEKIVFWLIRK